MSAPPIIHRNATSLGASIESFRREANKRADTRLSGLCGFDGFIDSFIRLNLPPSMAEFGPKVAAAAGVAASYPASRLGEKFGGNGPLFASALHGINDGTIDITYIGALGRDAVLPIYEEALRAKTKALHTLSDPAHTTCLEFSDGKVMLCDMAACDEITWERLVEVVPHAALDGELKAASFLGLVNWGKLPHAGPIWSNLATRLVHLGVSPKHVICFMDLAEFEHRPAADLEDLLGRLGAITNQCRTILSFNLKEAWQMGEALGGNYHGRKDPDSVAELAGFLRSAITVDRVVVHPNNGAACASAETTVYVPGPHCREPLISTGAGDHFGAGCLSAALRGFDDTGLLLAGNATSGYFVRSGRTPSFLDMASLLEDWASGTLPERIPTSRRNLSN